MSEDSKIESGPGELTQGVALQVEDLSDMADQYLSDATKQALKKTAKQTIAIENNRVVAQAMYFGATVRKGNEEKAVKLLSEKLNELVEKDCVHSFLSGIISMDLARMTLQAPRTIVLVYPLINDDKKEEAQAIMGDLNCGMGGMPVEIEDTSLELEDGEFLAEMNFSYTLGTMKPVSEMVDKEIELYLSVLPEDTEVREITACAVSNLSIPYEVKFYNPKLNRVKQVAAQFCRAAEVVDGNLEQFKVFTGIRYIGKDGEDLYTSGR